ncbi:copper chaperone PCu(A)C [Maritalea porphyrae]|uniref:copper chaperone PCu(A)C n=1 Tax=Maritalea porphyrae TaxID=880732 RepID=UPI0022B07DF6|nr:copper chaperone PCu(A)C [Maritalea porphyrae]MCZ4273350.1 copper chaperone PCu(A)C [Maritalea porphyrae]
MNVMVKSLLAISVTLLSFVGTALAEVVAEDAWSRASIGMTRPGAAYMNIRNAGVETEVLIGLRTDLALKPEIHLSSINDKGVSSMLPAGEIEIAPGETIELKPGGLHVMLMGLQLPLMEGDTFLLTLLFADDDEVTVEIPIFGIAARGPGN